MRVRATGLALALLLASAWFGSSWLTPSRADSSGALVVTTCGTLPLAYAAGSTRQLTVNTSGLVCL